MPKHDEDLAPLIRGVFLPEEGEVWASADYSQQEFRLVVHYAVRHKLTGAVAARDRYIDDPGTDMHAYASELTGGAVSRQDGKSFNFMTIYGAGPETTALQIKKPLSETKALLALYHEKCRSFRSSRPNARTRRIETDFSRCSITRADTSIALHRAGNWKRASALASATRPCVAPAIPAIRGTGKNFGAPRPTRR
jgi:DNA polymerase I-like protein with 3'-5' exonuclease and polymerase domains